MPCGPPAPRAFHNTSGIDQRAVQIEQESFTSQVDASLHDVFESLAMCALSQVIGSPGHVPYLSRARRFFVARRAHHRKCGPDHRVRTALFRPEGGDVVRAFRAVAVDQLQPIALRD